MPKLMMRTMPLLFVAVVTGCVIDAPHYFEPIDAAADGATPDADCAPGTFTFTLANVAPCDVPRPIGDFVFPSGAYFVDTSAGTIEDVGGVPVQGLAFGTVEQPGNAFQAMVIVADNLTIGVNTSVRATGSRPLVIVAQHTVTIRGMVDLTGHVAESGAGGDVACNLGAGHDGVRQLNNGHDGGAGGGGGAATTAGGTGAHVNPNPQTPSDTAGGTAWLSSTTPLVGGCSGGHGGHGSSGNMAAPGGHPGGAVEIVGGDAVVVDNTGIVSVSGGGGRGAIEPSGGGAGGGAGGAILMQSQRITITGFVTANGGGGGQGNYGANSGSPGADGSTNSAIAASGGTTGGGSGGNGGNGGVGTSSGANGLIGTGDATTVAGGGGGGGGVGLIHLDAASTNLVGALISPPPT